MDAYRPAIDSFDDTPPGISLARHLAIVNTFIKENFDEAHQLIQSRLQDAMASLQQSSTAIRMMLAAQHPDERASPAGLKLQQELEALLSSSVQLSRMASAMQDEFSANRRVCEQRSETSISRVVEAVERHRSTVQDNAIALTEAALMKARMPLSLIDASASRSAQRRSR